jgi:hypothetical protein
MLSLDIHNTQGMEFELCQIKDESKQVTQKKMPKKNGYFLRCWFKHISRVGGMQEWSCPSDAEYMPSKCKYSFIKIAIHGK